MIKKVLFKSGRVALLVSVMMVSMVGCSDSNEKTYEKEYDNNNIIGDMGEQYVEKSKYSKDVAALDTVKVAVSILVADPDARYKEGKLVTLKKLMDSGDPNKVISSTIEDTFDENGKFINASSAFEGVTIEDIYVKIVDGLVSVKVESRNKSFNDYIVGRWTEE